MIIVGKSYIAHDTGNSKLCADIQIDEKHFTIYFMIDDAQENYFAIGRADAFVMSILPLAIQGNHEIICEELLSERLCYQLNEYLIPALIFEKGREHLIKIKAPFIAEPYLNQKAVGTIFDGSADSIYTIMKHWGECEYPLSYITVFNIGLSEEAGLNNNFEKLCNQAYEFAGKYGLKTIVLDTNLNEVLQEKFKSICSFRNLACVLALQGLFSMYLMPSRYDAAQFKLDLENSARYDLLLAQCAATESLSIYTSGAEIRYKEKLEKLNIWHRTQCPYMENGNLQRGDFEGEKKKLNKSINIGNPYFTESQGRVYLCADTELFEKKQTIWFSVKSSYGKYMVEDRVDAFVVGLLTIAMRNGYDINCSSPVSRRLLYQINNYLIPTMVDNIQEYQYMRVNAKAIDNVLECVGAVGTGWTGGVDSMFTYMHHYEIETASYKLTNLLIANNGAITGKTRETLKKMTEKTENGFARERAISVIDVDSNLHEVLSENFYLVQTFRHGAIILTLQKLFKTFLVSATSKFSEFCFDENVGHSYEMFLFKLFETDNTVIYCGGGAFSRVQKLRELSRFKWAQKYLHPCIYALRNNCGRCSKCVFIEVALYGFGKLDEFSSVFDVNEFNRNKIWYFRHMLRVKENRDLAYKETRKLLEQNRGCAETLRILEHQMQSLVSVIIPVYNAELYIQNCISSVQQQSYSNLEIIIVDDGSTDSSMNICKEISESDQRIFYFQQEHRGVSATRNIGIRAASGKYLFFLDSDDMIHPELLETLYILLEKSDAAIAGEYHCQDETQFRNICLESRSKSFSKRYNYLNNRMILQEVLYGGKQGGIGGKMIRHTALKSIQFDENLTVGEDTKFIYQLIENGADAIILKENWYYYRKHENDMRKRFSVKECQSIYDSVRYISNHEKEKGRAINASRCEEYIVRCLLNWKKANRCLHDRKMADYLRKMIGREQKLEIFSQIRRHRKMEFYLMLYCYPLYCLYQKFLDTRNESNGTNTGEKRWDHMELVSVIIPMYNSERFIKQCIQSVINQTYSNMEIIVINDGSTDRSLEICESFCLSDDRIRVFSQENKGVSSARNYGLDIATGKYVFFLDSRDAIHPLLLEELVWHIEDQHADIALCEYSNLYPVWMETVLNGISDRDERPKWKAIEKSDSEEWIHKEHHDFLMRVGILIRRKSIGITKFSEELVYGEDALFLYHLLCKKLRLVYSEKAWYYHRVHQDKSFEKIKDDRYFDIYRILRDEENQREHDELSMLWERRLVWMMRQTFMSMKKEAEQCNILKKQALIEKKHPLFKKLPMSSKMLFLCCFFCSPLYNMLRIPAVVSDKCIWTVRTGISVLKGDRE